MERDDIKRDTDYSILLEQLEALTEGERDTIANLANASGALSMNLADVNWVGFYLMREEQLVLGPFQGKQLVEDVHAFPGHIACDGASNSEIVGPVYHEGRLVAVLDIDSPLFGRFGQRDKEGLEDCAALLGRRCNWKI